MLFGFRVCLRTALMFVERIGSDTTADRLIGSDGTTHTLGNRDKVENLENFPSRIDCVMVLGRTNKEHEERGRRP